MDIKPINIAIDGQGNAVWIDISRVGGTTGAGRMVEPGDRLRGRSAEAVVS